MTELQGRCATCRRWVKIGRRDVPRGFNACGLISRELQRPEDAAFVFVADLSDPTIGPPPAGPQISAGLYTAATYGCVQWEAHP